MSAIPPFYYHASPAFDSRPRGRSVYSRGHWTACSMPASCREEVVHLVDCGQSVQVVKTETAVQSGCPQISPNRGEEAARKVPPKRAELRAATVAEPKALVPVSPRRGEANVRWHAR